MSFVQTPTITSQHLDSEAKPIILLLNQKVSRVLKVNCRAITSVLLRIGKPALNLVKYCRRWRHNENATWTGRILQQFTHTFI